MHKCIDRQVMRTAIMDKAPCVFRRCLLMLSSYLWGSERYKRDQRDAFNCSKSYWDRDILWILGCLALDTPAPQWGIGCGFLFCKRGFQWMLGQKRTGLRSNSGERVLRWFIAPGQLRSVQVPVSHGKSRACLLQYLCPSLAMVWGFWSGSKIKRYLLLREGPWMGQSRKNLGKQEVMSAQQVLSPAWILNIRTLGAATWKMRTRTLAMVWLVGRKERETYRSHQLQAEPLLQCYLPGSQLHSGRTKAASKPRSFEVISSVQFWIFAMNNTVEAGMDLWVAAVFSS